MTSAIGYEYMNDVNHVPYSGQEGFGDNIVPFNYIPRSATAPPPSNSPPTGEYNAIWANSGPQSFWQDTKPHSLHQHDHKITSRNDPPCTSVSCPKLRSTGLQYEPYNNVNHIPY